MKILIIDSHKSTTKKPCHNLHWKNANLIAKELNGDFIWSYKDVNEDIKSDYDKIVFVHASHYSFVDYQWLKRSPEAELYYVVNEYNLGEPRILWMAAKEGRKYTVLANHPPKPSKIVMKYVNDWHTLDLNSLCFKDDRRYRVLGAKGCIYYGSFRKNRIPYFQKYLSSGGITLSTHSKNLNKFKDAGVNTNTIKRLNWDWDKEGLSNFKTSLYIEDTITHKHYNYLANRFYEALNYDVTPLFDTSCINTLEMSYLTKYEDYIVNCIQDVHEREHLPIRSVWFELAKTVKNSTLYKIKDIIKNETRKTKI